MIKKCLILTLNLSLILGGFSNPGSVAAHETRKAISLAPVGDYGDAPDGSLAGYEEPFNKVIGKFPSLFSTSNSRLGRTGAHALRTGQETLGLEVSVETDVIDPADPDGTINLVDEDSRDDGLRVGFDQADPDTPKTIDIVVAVAQAAPAVRRFVNMLVDRNHDGVWQRFGETEEWVIKNQEVNITPGSSGVAAQVPYTLIQGASPTWVRIVLTRAPISEVEFAAVGGWDGSGEFEFGEVEDHFLPVAIAIASAFASARAAASACAACDLLVASLAQAQAAAQANADAAAAALAQARASASAAAAAAAAAAASASAAASAEATARSIIQIAVTIIISIPCVTVVATLRATADAIASCAADARAQAEAAAAAAAAARAQADARAQAAAAALADAQAAAAAIATALAAARARAQACAAAVAQARAAASAAALAIALGGRLAYAAAVAKAFAAASAWAAAQAACQAIAVAFAGAQASAQASAGALAIAQAAAAAAAFAASVAQAAASAAAQAEASAKASADASGSFQAGLAALVDPSCKNQFCRMNQVGQEVRVAPGERLAVDPPHQLATLAQYGIVKFQWEPSSSSQGLMLDEKTGRISGWISPQASGNHLVSAVAVDEDGCQLARYDLSLVIALKQNAQR